MATWRVTFFFEFGDISWSEVYHPAATLSVDDVKKLASTLAQLRIQCLGVNTTARGSPRMPSIRISDEFTRRDAYPITDFALLLPKYVGSTASNPVQPHDVLELRGDTNAGLKRKIWYMACIPSAAYNSPSGVAAGHPEWWGKWLAFRSELMANWGVYALKPIGVAGPFSFDIESMTSVGNRVQLGINSGPYAAGTYILINRGTFEPNSPIIRGRFYTVPPTNGNTTIIVPGLTQPLRYLRAATVRSVEYEVFPLTNVQIAGKTSHKRGVESGSVPRGRRTIRR